MASLRGRILSGALLWTVGLFIGSLLVSTALMLRDRDLAVAVHGTASTHAGLGTVLVVLFLLAGLFQMRRALSSVAHLRARLARVHTGQARTLDGTYPSEVQPLVDDLNALLDHREEVVRRAVAKAGDLAHGLKTPLAVLAHEADRARAAGHPELADGVAVQVEGMRRQIDYHLAHARAAASGATPGAQSAVLASADGLARTLERLHAARGIGIEVRVDPAHVVRVQREDLDELLGNLLDNACKWTRTRVVIASADEGGRIAVTIDDDGPGVPAGQRGSVLRRGVRADEAAPGSGLGLAIVRDLAEVYGGSIVLEEAPGGGLRARLLLPSAA